MKNVHTVHIQAERQTNRQIEKEYKIIHQMTEMESSRLSSTSRIKICGLGLGLELP